MNLESKKILVTGGSGFLGRYVVSKLIKEGASKKTIRIPRSRDYDLRIAKDCDKVLRGVDVVVHLAANVGGIGYNQQKPGKLFYDNAIMGINMIEAARHKGVEKFVQVGSICSYPKFTPVPFKEKDLWSGYPEQTNAPYGIAKLMLLSMAQSYRSQYGLNTIYLLPVNLYGPGDNFIENTSHVIPALIKKFLEAKTARKHEVVVWGSGKATREFLFVEDAAVGIVLATKKYDKAEPVNIGIGKEISIRDLAKLIKNITGFKGRIVWDRSKPDGQPRRSLDVSKAKKEFGFSAKTKLEEGLKKTIEWYLAKKYRKTGNFKKPHQG